MGQGGQGRDSGAAGDLARGPARHERGQGHPHRTRRHDLARGGGRARHGQVLRQRRRCGARGLQGAPVQRRRQDLGRGRLDFAQRLHRRGLRRSGRHPRPRTQRRLRQADGPGRPAQTPGSPHQCRHTRGRQGGPQFWRHRHRPVSHRAHVLRRRTHPADARDDPGRRRGRPAQGAGQVAADPARRLRRPVPRDERASGHDPSARPAAARIRAPR